MGTFNYQEYLKNNPLLIEGENCGCKSTSCSCDTPKTDLNESMDYERKAVHKVIDGVANDFSGEYMLTRDYINAIIAALEELKITDF
tara:strand:- start:90 stop:350 length:261 start_codon:yes stop_codon:yes gene_type:complete